MKRFFISFILLNSFEAFGQEPLNIDTVKNKIAITNIDTQRVDLYNTLAWQYSYTNFDSAEKYTNLAILLADQIKDLNRKAVSYEMKAILYEISGQQEEAIKLYLKVIALREQLGGTGLENTFNNVAILFKNQKNHEKALEYFEKSYKIELLNKNKKGIVASLINIANSLSDLNKIDSSFLLSKKALDLALEIKDDACIVQASINMAERYNINGNQDSTLYYTTSVMEKTRELNMYYPLTLILKITADIFVERNQFQEALGYLNEAEELSVKTNQIRSLRSIYHMQAKANAGLNDYKKAYLNLQDYIQVNDAMINVHSIEVLNELEKKYETAKKDQNIALLNEKNARFELKVERQANLTRIIMFSAFIFILISGFVLFALRQRLKNQKLLAKKSEALKSTNFQLKMNDLELKALRSQMNPHFIFNCMNSINTMILNGESEEASRYLNKFSKLIRLILENSENPTISLDNELSMLETYIQLEVVRFQGKIGYEIAVDPSIDQSKVQIPAMVLQPFIENAIWHGLMHKEQPGFIKIEVKEEGDELKCTIEDNGVGRQMALKLQEPAVEKKRSMGIQITEERLKLVSKNRIKNWIQIMDLKDPFDKAIGTRVKINIPIN